MALILPFNYLQKKKREMNKKLIFIVLIFLTLGGFAQRKRVKNLPNYDRKRLHFGFTVGLNTMDFTIRNADNFNSLDTVYAIENIKSMGFHLGPISNLRLGEYFDLRLLINLSFGQRDLTYKIAQDYSSGDDPFKYHTMQIESIFIEFPLMIKYKAKRQNNYRPYLIGGVNPKIDLSAQKEIKDEERPKIRLNSYDLYYEMGFGIDYYLPYFKFSTEFKFAFGLNNMYIPDGSQFTNSMKYMHSKMFVVSLHFE